MSPVCLLHYLPLASSSGTDAALDRGVDAVTRDRRKSEVVCAIRELPLCVGVRIEACLTARYYIFNSTYVESATTEIIACSMKNAKHEATMPDKRRCPKRPSWQRKQLLPSELNKVSISGLKQPRYNTSKLSQREFLAFDSIKKIRDILNKHVTS